MKPQINNPIIMLYGNPGKKFRSGHIFLLLFLSILFSSDIPYYQESDPVVPVYSRLKDLHLETSLVAGSIANVSIVAPEIYLNEGQNIAEAIRKITGTKIPVIPDTAPEASMPLQGNLILLGNRSTNKSVNSLYDLGYTFLDLKYPGPSGYVVKSLHNPFGNGHNVLFAGGSDIEGVRLATSWLINQIRSAEKKKKEKDLSLGYLNSIQLGKGYVLPANIKEAEIWEASEYYKSSGYFGWNMVSKNMALYYMTGQEIYLKEFLRLAFPDQAAIKEIEEYDGERIENKNDPLSGPYHYSAHMMIILWDLIEESPAFSDDLRLKITNAFARQLPHRVVEGVYNRTSPPSFTGDRHADWSAFSLYVLGRYFQKDYPGQVWQHCIKSAELYFSAIGKTYWMGGNNDHLFWFTSFYDPLINYLVMTGNRDKNVLENLRRALNTQEILHTGLKEDWGIRASSLSMLNKAAYILNDGRWLYYRERVNLDTGIFRLGQSFWPGEEQESSPPDDLPGKWKIQFMPEGMFKSRRTNFLPEQSFKWGSYRSESGPGGDFILIKGYNGAGRNPYHTFDILELRLDGNTILKGYGNQVLSSADGMVEPKVAMDAALLSGDVTGDIVSVSAGVPDLPFINWKRSLILRNQQYAIIADELTFRTNSNNLIAETSWEMPGGKWIPGDSCIRVLTSNQKGPCTYELHSSDNYEVSGSKVINMIWKGSVRNGEKRTFFHLIGRVPGTPASLKTVRLSENAAALSLPEPGVAVTGKYKDLEGSFILLTENSVYGTGLIEGGQLIKSTEPAEVNWNFNTGNLKIVLTKPAKIYLAVTGAGLSVNDNPARGGTRENNFYVINLPSGRHEIKGAMPAPGLKQFTSAQIRSFYKPLPQKSTVKVENKSKPQAKPEPQEITRVMHANIGGQPVESIAIPAPDGELIGIASGKTVYVFNAEGKELQRMETAGEIRVLHWWAKPGLLLVGCADEKVIAFDANGQKVWEFTSVMDKAVYEAGKQYWFKSAHPGIYGLYSGLFDDNNSRAFVGSACTLEILDEAGHLVKRLPVFWGPGKQFMLVNAPDGSRNLLIGRWHNDREDFAIINSKTMLEAGRGYNAVPPGHSFVNGWDCMSRFDNYLLDLDGDSNREIVSAINGTWNRISVYSENGKPIYNVQIGPGSKEPRSNIRMMHAGDLDNDGKSEIVFGLASGLVNTLDARAEKLWSVSLSSPPVVTRIITQASGKNWICTGCEDGTILALDSRGNITGKTKISEKPADILILKTPGAPMAIITTVTGEINGFQFNTK